MNANARHFIAGRALAAAAIVGLTAMCVANAHAYRLIQNTGVGRFSSGYAVSCGNGTGFTHWSSSSTTWYRNTANQGSGKATATQSALASWTAVTPASYTLNYGGTTTAGFVTDNRNTVLWATGNGCTGGCLAITALVLQSGQRIVESDISFNNSYPWRTDGTNYDTQATMTHEFGHALGIHHTELTSTPRPTMYAAYFGTGGRSLETDDRNALNCIYNRYPPSAFAAPAPTELAQDPDEGEGGGTPDALPFYSRPSRSGVLIRFGIREAGTVKLQLFDVAGRSVVTLADDHRAAGEHELAWNGESGSGRVSPGVYFARLVTPAGSFRTTVVLR